MSRPDARLGRGRGRAYTHGVPTRTLTAALLLLTAAAPTQAGEFANPAVEFLAAASGGTDDGPPGDPAEGFRLLTEKAYLHADFDHETVTSLWKVWPDEAKQAAENASEPERRRMAFERYGLVEKPGPIDVDDSAVGYVRTDEGWHFSCFACHAGSIGGQTIYGLGNSHIDLQSLSEDSLARKLQQWKMPYRFDLAAQRVPLSVGAYGTNAIMFGVMVGQFRDADLDLLPLPRREPYVHHNHDAPPWWHAKHKSMLYIDGFAPKAHRPLVQFSMSTENDGPTVRDWAANDCRHILAYIESLKAPDYPHPIDTQLAAAGRISFMANCAECHGTYSDRSPEFGDLEPGTLVDYPERRVPVGEIGTDRVRLDSLTPKHRGYLRAGFLSRYGQDTVVTDPGGYVAPPLTGVWASGPYLHNGSVPTLWHLLHPSERPSLWRRTRDGYDTDRVGLEIETFERLPESDDSALRRKVFDASEIGKSIAGHDYPDRLQPSERRAVLEYLKTL